jgi:hypothetical protein
VDSSATRAVDGETTPPSGTANEPSNYD